MKKEINRKAQIIRNIPERESYEIIITVPLTAAVIIAIIGQKYFDISYKIPSIMVLILIAIKVLSLVKSKIRITEELVAISLMSIFWTIYHLQKGEINNILTAFFIMILIYSLGVFISAKFTLLKKNIRIWKIFK